MCMHCTLRVATVVNTIPADSTLMRCFAIMARLGVSGLGVTEPRASDQGGEKESASEKGSSRTNTIVVVVAPVPSHIYSTRRERLRVRRCRITRETLDVLAMSGRIHI